ncbi:hypothetical protein GCM10023149_37360 [Mucilaginibacter gynuensis]|uniref:Uncharacterized protein n=1 Tax=Mucilaginibacter gynuensis TaxID=1302236 RepID=A0ABP8GXS3_9SPHI
MKKIFSSIIGGLAGAVALNVIHQAFKAIERNGAGKGFGIDFDYSHLTVYTRQPYHFFDQTFQFWSRTLSPDKYQYNQQLLNLGNDNMQQFIIEEIDRINNPERLALLSK